MTNQHPLTDDIMYELHGNKRGYSNPFDAADMRAAADWQLEQVIEWLRHNLHLNPTSVDYVVENLREAMRPQQLEDN